MLSAKEIKETAAEIGFDLCGIAPCRRLEETERRFRDWLAAGRQADLHYLERNLDKRFDPRRLVEGRRASRCAPSTIKTHSVWAMLTNGRRK